MSVEAHFTRRTGNRSPVAAWRAQANCLGADPSLFFPEKMDPYSRGGKATRDAINTYCLPCAVQAECLAEGLGERYGVWGGKTPKERRKLRREQLNIRSIT